VRMRGSQLHDAGKVFSGLIPKPRKLAPYQFYSLLHYDERIKPTFEVEWAAACEKWEEEQAQRNEQEAESDDEDEDEDEDDKDSPSKPRPPQEIAVRTEVAMRLLEQESAAFRKALTEANKAEHKRNLENYQLLTGATSALNGTDEDIDR
jgi:hypothetical protein